MLQPMPQRSSFGKNNAGIYFVDSALSGSCIAFFHNAIDPSRAITLDTTIAPGVIQNHGQHRQRWQGLPEHLFQHISRNQRMITQQNQHMRFIRYLRHGLVDRMTGTTTFGLLDPID